MFHFYKMGLNGGLVIFRIINHLPISHPSPPAPGARRIPRELFCSTKESHAPLGQQATTFRRWHFTSDNIWKLIVNRVIQLSVEKCEWIWRGRFDPYICAVHSTITFGATAFLISTCWLALYGNDMYWGMNGIIAFKLKEEMPDLSPSVGAWDLTI